ncbi:unnamed protein product [Symbiodinium microadriaticum]|nr:unnamed protein product [Symbiodinium microadriaticum]CAE7935544.1 unnamed protein product [Symbiodinium sp. KB8]
MVVQFNGRIFVPGVLMRALRSDQAEQEGTDFVTILNASQKKFFPDSDIHDWTARYNTIKRLAEVRPPNPDDRTMMKRTTQLRLDPHLQDTYKQYLPTADSVRAYLLASQTRAGNQLRLILASRKGEVQRILRFIVTTERVNFAFAFDQDGRDQDLNLNDTTFLPAKQWQRIAEKEALDFTLTLLQDRFAARQTKILHLEDLPTLVETLTIIRLTDPCDSSNHRTYLMGSHNPSASSSVPEFNNAEFNSMLADFIQAANTSINQLQDRVQVLEEELKSLKQNHP